MKVIIYCQAEGESFIYEDAIKVIPLENKVIIVNKDHIIDTYKYTEYTIVEIIEE